MSDLFSNLMNGRMRGGSNTGTVEPYDGAETGSALGGGRRRRRTTRKGRKGRKGSTKRRRSRKQRLYGGNSQQQQEQQEQQEEQEQQQEEEEEGHDASGGARRKKGRRGKKTRGKVSAWITHVLKFAKDNKMKYFQALKDKRCRATYKSNK
jgi:hypothetical protein